MTIIEAIQAAEQDKLITNNFLKVWNSHLKYMGNGVFFQYELINGKIEYKYEVRDFSMAEILSTGWEILS